MDMSIEISVGSENTGSAVVTIDGGTFFAEDLRTLAAELIKTADFLDAYDAIRETDAK